MAGYLTVKGNAEATVREKMSRFIAFIHPVQTAAEAKSLVAEYTNRYHDARHVCWGYMIGANRTDFLSSDNGEPSGTAGKPILGQINSFSLTNVIIIVVRYFGGIKLGTSGLIAAYRESARQAIEAAEIIECHEQTSLTITFPYLVMNDVMRLVKSEGLTIVSQSFDNTCQIAIQFPLDIKPQLIYKIEKISGVSITPL